MRQLIKPTKNELIKLLSDLGDNHAVARHCGVSEASVRRWRDKYSLPRGYSSKIAPATNEDLMALLKSKYRDFKLPIISPTVSTKETIVSQLSDLHIGSIVKNNKGVLIFNKQIAQERAILLCSKLIYLIKNHIFSSSKVDEIVLLLTGDMVDGEGVYEGQSYNLEEVPPYQVMICFNVLKSYILELIKLRLPIRIYAVRGNHGRTGKANSEKSNWDVMLYLILQMWLNETKIKNVYFEFAEGLYLNLEIKGWTYQIRHEGPKTSETPSGAAKVGGWNALYGIDALCYGHLHHWAIGDWLGIRTFMCGSLKGVDDLSDRIAKGSAPSQLIWGVSQKHISTFQYAVDLE